MSKKAGQLLWNRQRMTLAGGVTTIDTGLTQVSRSFESESIGEPPLGVTVAPPGPADGMLPASRIQVIPMAPLEDWSGITHGEPFVDPATNTVKVTFTNTSSPPSTVTPNVLFWDPHSMMGPGDADTYNPEA